MNRSREYAMRFHRHGSFPQVSVTWKNQGWNWRIETSAGECWSMTELCGSEELLAEGMAMNHCVGSYSHRCQDGFTAIFSLQCDGKRKVTIDVNLLTMSLGQVKGRSNREAKANEKEVVDQWFREVVLAPAAQGFSALQG